MLSDPEIVIRKVTSAFDSLSIPYLIGGSIASSIYGEPRLTHDVDFVAEIRPEQVSALVSTLQNDFYIDAEMIQEAIQTRSVCNFIHLATMVKADVFIKQSDAWAEEVWRRRRRESVGSEGEEWAVLLASPEDMVLQKLAWFRLGGGVSDRQWRDIQGMLEAQSPTLDFAYLHRWATELRLSELLQEALEEAGITESSSNDS